MITFTAAEKVDAISTMRALNSLNGSDTEMRLDGKPFSITFLRSAATGTEEQDELEIEFVWRVPNTKSLENVYNALRSSINKDIRIAVGTIEFRGRIADTTKFPPGTDLNEMMNSKFALTLNNIHGSSELKTSAKKDSAYIYLEVPDNIWSTLMQMYNPDEEAPIPSDVEPHITISYIPEVTKEQLPYLELVINDFCNRTNIFNVKMEGSDIFGQDNNGYAYVGLIKCPQLAIFKESLDEFLNDEFGPDFVRNKYSEYKPHVTLEYLENKTDEPKCKVKPVAWGASKVFLSCNDKVSSWDLVKGQEELNKQHDPDAHSTGYRLVNELEIMGYYKAASFLRSVLGTITPHSVADKLRIIASQIEDEKLAERCLRVADDLPQGTDDRIRDAITPFVSPEKMDEAVNAVIETLKFPDEEGEEIDSGARVPRTDPHVNKYIRSPQTQLIDRNAPEGTKAVEFGKRNF